MRLLEPLGLLDETQAAAAIAAGVALPLAGGPLAFSLARLLPEPAPRSTSEIPPGWEEPLRRLIHPPAGGWLQRPSVMGVINVTPDSFSDGGDYLDPGRAVAAGLAMAAAGAAVVDVGGESTRPGATPTPPEIEQARVLPVIRELARQGLRVSADTCNATTMAAALDAGAAMINDTSALSYDPDAAPLLARASVPVILMHTRGSPVTMMTEATYADVAQEVTEELAARVAHAEAAGIARDRIALDPGIGFAKTGEHNLELLSRFPLLLNLGCPLVVGVSRKRFIGQIGGQPEPRRRLAGSLAAALFALTRGASMLRVHDVVETMQALRVWQALAGARIASLSLALAAG
ncbi:MAG: dihydropteroate synthase [Acetobacteraceae bacterium]